MHRSPRMDNQELDRLYRRMLLELWHAPDAELARIVQEIAAQDLAIHQRGQTRRGWQQLVELIRQGRAPFDGVQVTILNGPLIDADQVAARWQFSGRYAGGIPGANAPIGQGVAFTGMDLIRSENRRIAEYWVYSDAESLMAQLGV